MKERDAMNETTDDDLPTAADVRGILKDYPETTGWTTNSWVLGLLTGLGIGWMTMVLFLLATGHVS